jgi:hypothetical protein
MNILPSVHDRLPFNAAELHAVLFVLLLAALALTGCDTPGPQPPTAPQGDVSFTLARSANSALPAGVGRARVRLVEGDDPSASIITDIEIPAAGGTRQVEIPAAAGTYQLGLVLYDEALGEAYSFADTAGVEVQANLPTEVTLQVDSTAFGPDYLLGEELQIRPSIPEAIDQDLFWPHAPLQAGLPTSSLHYAPSSFGLPAEADYVADMVPEMGSYYIAQLDSLDAPAFADSVFLRVQTPLLDAWDAEGYPPLSAISPSVAGDQAPHSLGLDGSIIIVFSRPAITRLIAGGE